MKGVTGRAMVLDDGPPVGWSETRKAGKHEELLRNLEATATFWSMVGGGTPTVELMKLLANKRIECSSNYNHRIIMFYVLRVPHAICWFLWHYHGFLAEGYTQIPKLTKQSIVSERRNTWHQIYKKPKKTWCLVPGKAVWKRKTMLQRSGF